MSNSLDNLITIKQYMERFSVVRKTVYNRIDAGKIKIVEVAGRKLIDASKLTAEERQHKKPKQ